MLRASGYQRSLARAGRAFTALAIMMSLDGRPGLDAQKYEPSAAGSRVLDHERRTTSRVFWRVRLERPRVRLRILKPIRRETHRNRLDEAWRKAQKDLVGKLSAFQKQELSGDPAWGATVFYPFGGPDAMTATLLFPKSPVYVIVGWNPRGRCRASIKSKKRRISPSIWQRRGETMASGSWAGSFFVTRDMDRQFRGQVTDGLLIPILQLLVRTDHQVLGFRYVRLDDEGKIIERAPTYKAPTRFGNKGVEIEYKMTSDSSLHTLYYFSVNLSNERLIENKPFLSYLSRLTGVTTFLKATSYLTHKADFSMIRTGYSPKAPASYKTTPAFR